jgi:hypothetical protein
VVHVAPEPEGIQARKCCAASGHATVEQILHAVTEPGTAPLKARRDALGQPSILD